MQTNIMTNFSRHMKTLWNTTSAFTLFLCSVLSVCFASSLYAGDIRVSNGKALTVTGKTVTTHCDTIFIAGGSSLILEGTAILQDIRLSNSGSLLINSGAIRRCMKFYVIPRPDGSAAIISL
jgi:hypothetical protein